MSLHDAGIALLLLSGLAGLALVPFGLPGLWLIVLGIVGAGWLSGFRAPSGAVVGVSVGLAAAAEAVEAWIGFRFAQRYGGSRRAGWGALVGGLAGAIIGVPIPLIGSVIGGFVGAFAGAAVFEYTRARRSGGAARAGWGAVLGRAASVAVKIGVAVVMLCLALYAVWRG